MYKDIDVYDGYNKRWIGGKSTGTIATNSSIHSGGVFLVGIPLDELEVEIKNSKLLAPNNFGHKAGDGTKTRKRYETETHPAFAYNAGSTQATYLQVEVQEATKKGYAVARSGRDSVNLSMPGSKTRRGRVGVDMANTLDTSCNQGIFVEISPDLTVYAVWYPKKECYVAIRKLTPKECFRLQGWTDDYFEKAQFVNSDSQLYKQAGNGITVNVLYDIAKKLN